MIYIAADHAGFELKENIKQFLQELNEQFKDLGTDSTESVDYPDYAKMVVEKVGHNPQAKGILICGSGQGVCIAANKFAGIRAAQAWTPELAKVGRNDDDINVLCLAGRHQNFGEVKPIIKTFLDTPFDAVDRRIRRIKKIGELEK